MAGRPRARIKELSDWAERAELLLDELTRRMPKQYQKHCDKLAGCSDREYHLGICATWDRDRVAALWIEAKRHATGLAGELEDLAMEIEYRAIQRGLQLDHTLLRA